VGDFRLVALIGQGGMGQVWEAEQVSLKRAVAVKFVRPERVTAHQLELFAREARAGGRLNHPGIVAIHGHGESDGLAWIAMEFVGGAWTLKDFLDEATRLPELPEGYDRHVARFVAEIAEAMQAAHDARVIHRDLKPQNVLITADDRPKVTDFGLARITDEVALSVTGDFAGTYFYMSPEQAMAKRMGIDHRTDIFSLGVVLYELLALRRPFEGDTSHQVTEQIMYRDPPDLHTIRSKIPRDLAVIAGKALEKERDRRFATMKELAADLRRHLANEPIHARPPTTVERGIKWIQRNPGKSSAAAIVALALVVISALLFANVRANRALEAKTLESEGRRVAAEEAAKSERAAAERERRRADEVLRLSTFQRLDDLVREADELWPITPALVERYERWLSDAEKLVAELPSYEATLGELRARGKKALSEGKADWAFDSPEDRWWHAQLVKLIEGLRAFSDEDTGLSSAGSSSEHGWGIARRLEFARTIEERSLTGAEARAQWDEALASIRDECPWYAGLELTPQLGLLPIGQDPDSGLWEFAHLQTGEPAERGEDGKLILREGFGLVLVLLPGGTFRMGAQRADPSKPNYDQQAESDEWPVHEVTLSPFFLSKYEMTQGQWERFMGRNPSNGGPGDRFPVELVSWTESDEVCRHLGLSLPSEAQWEYGARGGTSTPWWSGEDPSLLVEVSNLADESYRRSSPNEPLEVWDDGVAGTARVGSYAPNVFGLHDVHGNVWEWCLDWHDGYLVRSDARVDPVLTEQRGFAYRVYRGGCLGTTASFARSAFRRNGSPSLAVAVLGLRPARALLAH
jgi:formylglycine-generating enzyme required for sulfatase activity